MEHHLMTALLMSFTNKQKLKNPHIWVLTGEEQANPCLQNSSNILEISRRI
uniref:Uncharacterized protein n=1 Tax=Helianthus annuus TaxID=4232 RepID=A0A251RPH0_HELAN